MKETTSKKSAAATASASYLLDEPIEKPDSNHDAIKNWSQEEKFHLFEALRAYGRHDLQKIQEYIMTKDVVETKIAIDYYSNIALQHPALQRNPPEPKIKPSRKPLVPLSSWTKLLMENLGLEELITETAIAVRMIAECEDIPNPEHTDNIDFREVYHTMANAMEGRPLTPNIATMAVLHKSLVETALSSKAFIKAAATKYIINNLDFSEKDINMFPRPTEDHELSTLRYLASQRRYNPIKIPENYLKPSYDNKCDSVTTDSS